MQYVFQYHYHYIDDDNHPISVLKQDLVEADSIELAKSKILDKHRSVLDYDKEEYISNISIGKC